MKEGTPLHDMLMSPNKEINVATGILSQLWRMMLVDLNIGPRHWNILMERYLHNPFNGVRDNAQDRTYTRGNLTKELNQRDMSWNVFMKGLRFLGAHQVQLSLNLKRKAGDTDHLITLELMPEPGEDYLLEEEMLSQFPMERIKELELILTKKNDNKSTVHSIKSSEE